jgi:chitin disaccharide deacetylase
MRYLIVNADDFGFSPTINAGVCEAHLHGVVTDASLLVRSPYAAHAVQLAHQANFPIGIHVDLVTPFVYPHSHALGPESNLVRELFRREFEHQPGQPIACELLVQIHREIRAQIREFSEMVGRLPTHLDYHFGLHYLPEVMAIYLIVADEFQIPVRWGCQYAGENPYPLAPKSLCDRFRGIATGGLDLFLSLVRQPWEGVMEMICHPGYFTPEGLPDSYNREREHELQVLTDPRLSAGLEQEAIELVNYDWLKAHAPNQSSAKP